MSERHDRRAAGVNRVNVARLVDICGRDASVPAFEAESIELSGRGMHVRTPYLPPLGAPLVCRLDHGGREIVVEGVVAWQEHNDGGGEFGIQFTALDSGSVEALKTMCGIDTDVAPEAPAKASVAEPDPSVAPPPAGLPVKLHIDGLGAPMKARVRGGGSRKLQVGSNLEFLKVGRGLQVEDVEHGARRGARIDAVSIAIDPETQVPQLVVALRYDGEDTTPEPSVIGHEEAAVIATAKAVEATASAAPVSLDQDEELDDTDDEDDDAEPALRGKVDAFAVSVGKAAKNTGEKLAAASGTAATGFAKWAKLGGARLIAMAKRDEVAKRRSTAKAPAAAPPAGSRRLRPQNSGRDEAEESPVQNKKRLIAIVGGVSALSLVIAGIAVAGHSPKSASAAPASAVPAVAPLATTPQPASLFMTPPPAMAAVPNTFAVNGMGAPGATMPGNPGAPGAAVANVPLFGPTPMATLEPAPLGPPPTELAAAPGAPHGAAEERMDDEEPKASAHDESFGDSDSKKDKDKDKADKSAEAKAEEVKPWGDGKMHLPLVFRMKLDKPGTAISGKKEASGFSVVIPGRKVEGSGSAIEKRDDRIATVRAKNGPTGAHVTFVFRSKVPSYKVRLRKSYVEFFVSSPDSAK